MKIIFGILLAGFLTGCATPPSMVSMRFKPNREGVIKMPVYNNPNFETKGRAEATSLMKKFCGRQRPEIVSIDKSAAITGSTSTQIGGVQYSELTSDNENFIHFDCVDEATAGLEPLNALPMSKPRSGLNP